MALNPSIILQGQGINAVGALSQGAQAGQQINDFRQTNALRDLYRQRGGEILAGDQGALNALAQFSPEAALGVQTARLGQENTRLGMEATRQRMEMLSREEQRAIDAQAAQMTAAERAAEAARIEQGVAQALQAQTPEQWDAIVSQYDESLVGQFENRDMIAGRYMSIAESLRRMDERAAGPDFRMLTPEEVEQMKLEPGSYQMGADGKVSRIGGGGQTINVNTADPVDQRPMTAAPAKDFQRVWDAEAGTWRDEVIPGSETDIQMREAADKSGARQSQGELMIGTTIDNLNLNIAELENGGLPVTGVAGEARRSFLGRMFTGESAMDFQNRSNQITDAAALAEISRMRQNSPTGGAVGALTDGERVAIGNAVTALNTATSAEEYLRAAKAYRQLALDLAYGEGRWQMNSDGSVSAVAAPNSGPTESAGEPTIDELLQMYGGDN